MPRTCSRCASVSNAPGQQVVDRHVVPHGLAREARREADQAGTRAVRQAELELRDLHAARHDVDDAAEAARHHAVDGQPHHLDVAEHHGVERRDPVVARPGAEIAGQAAFGIVHQDVRLRAGGERRLAALRRRDVGRDRRDASRRARGFPPRCAPARSRLRATIVTSTPSCASASAQALPRPRLAPESSALRPRMPRSMTLSHRAICPAKLGRGPRPARQRPVASGGKPWCPECRHKKSAGRHK